MILETYQDDTAGDRHEFWMSMALEQAQKAALCGEIPVGAVLVRDNLLLAATGNSPIGRQDPTAHAEILAIREAAGRIGNYRLPGTTLYVTLEPCIMCMGAVIQARIDTLVFGAHDPKTGAVESCYRIGSDALLNHTINLKGGILADACGALLKDFFRTKRREKK
ncbi:MAG: tRNA adenosine(34) deaminase TadA [Desulfocapsaceae bacterium]|nr:tRNA adenosine(34) deaminase TadA [Desulfocapsaceae bacterium]